MSKFIPVTLMIVLELFCEYNINMQIYSINFKHKTQIVIYSQCLMKRSKFRVS